jgi:hypothetical protein
MSHIFFSKFWKKRKPPLSKGGSGTFMRNHYRKRKWKLFGRK